MRRVAAVVLAVALLPALGGCVSALDVLDVVFPEPGPEEPYVPSPEELVVPERFTIIPDPWQARYVGVLDDGRQYFATADVDLLTDKGYVSVYYWAADGSFESADIDEFAELADIESGGLSAAVDARHKELAGATIEPITVAPFSIEQDGITFGFIARGPDSKLYDIASVTHMPNDDMVYYWPWDGEGYDT
ncbi:hypothetical protein EYE40_01185 [Glaciihabitans arcticus]|uniref:DUF3179 domain-containing protein n=1 Tax=Glaciihabitans arcticus TaxID=2668039 RepID=A0A4V2JEM3_9MICO|nr:hypothetical protein [Glaciihabitans arcticus]TBN56119.1 hypothetical protein EYE40_01185 [Glaciihabitans arcticus]